MAIPQRNTTITGIFAEDATTTIPTPPVAGTSYRDESMTEEDVNQGWPFKNIVDSSQFNQAMYEYSTISKMAEKYGFIPWSNLTDYEAGSLCLGTDGNVYQAVQASGPSSTASNPVNDTANTYWVVWLDNYQLGIGDVKTSVRTANHGNWFLCNGQAISRTTYATLFSIIGTNYGTGDGSTTFNIPDFTDVALPTSSEVNVMGNGYGLGLTSSSGVETAGYWVSKDAVDKYHCDTIDINQSPILGTKGGGKLAYGVTGVTTNPLQSGLTGSLKNSMSMNFFIRVK